VCSSYIYLLLTINTLFFSSADVDSIKLVLFHVPFIARFLIIGSCLSGNNTIVSEESVASSVV